MLTLESFEQAAEIESICFPPNEACSEKNMRDRVRDISELFLVAVDKENGKIAGFLNGLATDEPKLRDEFFTDAGLHNPNGKNIMLLGLDVLPEYRRQGLARELMYQYLKREKENGRTTKRDDNRHFAGKNSRRYLQYVDSDGSS